MVKLTRIYTKTGDDGSTGLVGGVRVSKASLRVEAYGAVDEANAAIGLAIAAGRRAVRDEAVGETLPRVLEVLTSVQHDLFDAGADLATPAQPGQDPDQEPGKALRITPGQTERLERLIDECNAPLGALTSFVLPGGSEPAACLHVARTVVRRAERVVVALCEADPQATPPEVLRYLNRLSDLLFVLARAANDQGRSDVLWVPGANRAPG